MSRPFKFDKDYERFKFPGFGSDGTCFLRVRAREQGIVFLCAQLKNYRGTSITNAIEEIVSLAIKTIDNEGVLHSIFFTEEKSGFSFFQKKKKSLKLEDVMRILTWIEYYPPGAGLSPSGSYALVGFDDGLNPVWNYVTQSVAAREAGVDDKFLRIDAKRLQYE